MLSTPVWLAASISITSTSDPSAVDIQMLHWPHGAPSLRSRQFSPLDNSRAVDVFPGPRLPTKR